MRTWLLHVFKLLHQSGYLFHKPEPSGNTHRINQHLKWKIKKTNSTSSLDVGVEADAWPIISHTVWHRFCLMVLCTLSGLEYFVQDAWQFLGAPPTSFSSIFTSCWNLPFRCILSSLECCLYKLYQSSIRAALQKCQDHVLKEKHKNMVYTCIEKPSQLQEEKTT